MKIDLIQQELFRLNYKTELKGNELYINCTKDGLLEAGEYLISACRLSFAGEFCMEREGFIMNVLFVNRKHGYYVILRYKADAIISLQHKVYQAGLYEREIRDLFGLEIMGGFDSRNLVKHECWQVDVFPLRKEYPYGIKIKDKNELSDYEYKQISGEGGYQIAVGPVHAGIIEPGHFRFSTIGEQVENLELRLMYKHRGIEKVMENVEADKLNLIFERVAGESSAAYSEVYALLVEKLAGYEVPEQLKALRTIVLELERVYNYLEDIAGICLDVGFSYPSKKFSYFAELIHQLCERITGSRFLRNSIVPLGNNIHFSREKAVDIVDTIQGIVDRFNQIVDITLNSVSFLDRVEHTGIVRNDKAVKLGVTGLAGRASGINYDVRNSFSYELYKTLKKPVRIETLGGVFERYRLKIHEINNGFEYIKKSLLYINEIIPKKRDKIILTEGMEAVVSVETVKGELIVYGLTGKDNRFSRIYLRTPSFANWNALTFAVLNEIVPDFPLCNKSFNMSYSENDR